MCKKTSARAWRRLKLPSAPSPFSQVLAAIRYFAGTRQPVRGCSIGWVEFSQSRRSWWSDLYFCAFDFSEYNRSVYFKKRRVWLCRNRFEVSNVFQLRFWALGWSGLYSFFENARLHPLSDTFFSAVHDDIIKIYIFLKENNSHAHTCVQNITWDVKKRKCENHTKWSHKRCKMMRGFQIWPPNSSQTTSERLFGPPKYSKTS